MQTEPQRMMSAQSIQKSQSINVVVVVVVKLLNTTLARIILKLISFFSKCFK